MVDGQQSPGSAQDRGTPQFEVARDRVSARVREQTDSLLRERVRVAIALMFVGAAAYAFAAAWLPHLPDATLHVIRALQVSLLVFAFLELGRPGSRERAALTALVVVATALGLSAAYSMAAGGVRTLLVTCLTLNLAASILIPWGARAQAIMAAATALCVVVNLQVAGLDPLAALGAAGSAALLLGLAAAVYTAHGFAEWRWEKARRRLEREEAQRQLRDLNATLEAGIEKRTHELEGALRELKNFSYTVSHDLRSPLRAVNGFAQELRDELGDDLTESGADAIDRIRSASERMGDMIDALLGLGRVSQAELRPREVDLTQFARSIADELTRKAPDRQVEWTIEDGLSVRADPRLARLQLEKLLGNAFKFTDCREVARIEFRKEDTDDGPAYCVRDNGVGFDMAHQVQLFRPFYRLHGDGGYEGTGIGLATVRRIAERHGGRVWAVGHEDEGAGFYFTFGKIDEETERTRHLSVAAA